MTSYSAPEGDTEATLEKLIAASRKLTQDYLSEKQNNFERYIDESLKRIQDTIVARTDQMLTRSREIIANFIAETRVDVRPVVPVALALVTGYFMGVYVDSLRDQRTRAR